MERQHILFSLTISSIVSKAEVSYYCVLSKPGFPEKAYTAILAFLCVNEWMIIVIVILVFVSHQQTNRGLSQSRQWSKKYSNTLSCFEKAFYRRM